MSKPFPSMIGVCARTVFAVLFFVVWNAEGQQDKSGLAGTVNPPPGRAAATAPAPSTPQPGAAPTVSEPQRRASELRASVSQLMMVTLQGLYGTHSDEREFLQRYVPGGLVIPVVVEPRDAAEYIKELRGIEARTRMPFLIGAQLYDLPQRQRVFPISFVQLPTLLSLAASTDLGAVKQLAGLTAEHLAAMGFNLNLGPRLELAPSLPSAVGGVDNLGSDPRFASDIGATILDTLKEKEILSMPMGFPGGGGNRTGASPATLLTPKVHLMDMDLLPYRRAIEHETPLIHVGNTLVPTLDTASMPASLSPAVIHDLLRGELKYEGVVVAGPMDVPEIQRQYDSAAACVMALRAGADMLFWEETGQKVSRAIEAIAVAVESGTLDRDVIDKACARVLALKNKAGLGTRKPVGAMKAATLGKANRYPKESYEVERRSITVVRNVGNILPLTRAESTPVGVTGIIGLEPLTNLLKKKLKKVAEQDIMTAKQLGDIEDFEIERITKHIEGLKTVVCVFGPLKRQQGEVRLIRDLKQAGVRVVLVWLGYPRPVMDMLEADGIVIAYCDPAMCAESIKAVADVLVGDCPVAVLPAMRELETSVGKEEAFNAPDVLRAPAGRLPVSLGEQYAAGFGLSYDPAPFVKKAEWDFGDGTRSSGVQASHAYKAPGQYVSQLTVTDQSGAVTSGTFSVVVK